MICMLSSYCCILFSSIYACVLYYIYVYIFFRFKIISSIIRRLLNINCRLFDTMFFISYILEFNIYTLIRIPMLFNQFEVYMQNIELYIISIVI